MLGAGETTVGHTERFVPSAPRASFFEPAPASAEALRQRLA
jgi:chemotaxis protein methyltransferase CheR